jgi:hypothetical protein
LSDVILQNSQEVGLGLRLRHFLQNFRIVTPHAASDRVGDSTQSFGQAMPESSCVIYQKSQKVGLGFRGLRHCHLQKVLEPIGRQRSVPDGVAHRAGFRAFRFDRW